MSAENQDRPKGPGEQIAKIIESSTSGEKSVWIAEAEIRRIVEKERSGVDYEMSEETTLRENLS